MPAYFALAILAAAARRRRGISPTLRQPVLRLARCRTDIVSFNAIAGEGYLIDLLATANGGIGCEGCVAVGNAGIDPYIWIDPSQAGQFSLLISAGVPNVPFPTGVPETSTWAMMLIGFAGLSFAYRRRLSLP